MDALIVLCRFCERDGPSILMVTQADRSSIDTPSDIKSMPGGLGVGGGSGGGGGGGHHYTHEHFSSDPSPDLKSASSSKHCPACVGVPPTEAGIFSRDDRANINYVTTPQPLMTSLYAALRQACLRAFYCEVCPGREGPIYFGDDHNGHVLSYLFRLADAKARGLNARFCILVLSRDKLALLNSWPFLVQNIRKMVERLQGMADRVSNEEQSQQTTRSKRLQGFAGGGGGSAADMLQLPVRQNLIGSDAETLRSLAELTSVGGQDQEVFYKVHAWFTWLLRALSRRWEEYVLEGGPLDDDLVRLQRGKEFKEQLQQQSNDDFQRNQFLLECFTRPGVCELRRVRDKLGDDQFHQVAMNVCLGNQLVVFCGQCLELAIVVTGALARLLPLGCVKEVLDAEECVHSYLGNFVVLSCLADVGDYLINAKEGEARVLLKIQCNSKLSSSMEPLPLTEDTNVTKWVEDLLAKSTLSVQCSPRCSMILPKSLQMSGVTSPASQRMAYLLQIGRILNCPVQTESTLLSGLIVAREEWLSKARLLFSYTRDSASQQQDKEAQKAYRALLTALQCSPDSLDEMMIRFWQRGLSEEYRKQVYQFKRPSNNSSSSAQSRDAVSLS